MYARKLTVCLLLCLLLLFSSGSLAAAQVPSAILSACESVVRIQSTSAAGVLLGSGFVVANDKSGTYIATNWHVVEDNPAGVSVWLGESDLRSAAVLTKSETNDIAILKLSQSAKQLRPLPLSTIIKQGTLVYALGFPGAADYLTESGAVSSSEITITDGLVSATREVNLLSYGPKVSFLQINAAINPGNSGGPLLDSKGNVVGINTLSIIESAGIGGAVSSSELIKVMDSFDLAYAKPHATLPFILIAAGLVVLAGIAFVLLRFVRLPMGVRTLSLDAFARKLGRAMTPNEAVSLLMPVMLEVRNANQEGRLLQKLSTETICVKNGSGYLDAKRLSESLLTVRFAAPEQLSGGLCSAGTDVYSLCMILRDLTAAQEGQTPENPTDATFARILAKGLAQEPADRYASAQELILALSPYNAQTPLALPRHAAPAASIAAENAAPTAGGQSEVAIAERPMKRRAKRRPAILVAALAVGMGMLIAVAGHIGLNYLLAIRYLDQLDLDSASTATQNIWFYQIVPEEDWRYLYSSIYTADQEFDKAYDLLYSLGDYRNSGKLALALRYRQAAYLANQSDYDGALSIYRELGECANSASLVSETEYRKGLYEYEHQNYEAATKIFDALAKKGHAAAKKMLDETNYAWGCALLQEADYFNAYIILRRVSDYAVVKELLSDLPGYLYEEAIGFYRENDLAKARLWFKLISSYERSQDYLFLIDVAETPFPHEDELYAIDLSRLIDFENAKELLFSRWTIAQFFLLGTWKSEEENWYAKFGENERSRIVCDSNLPSLDLIETDDFYFSDGIYWIYTESVTEPLYYFSVFSFDCITVTSYLDGSFYVLYRQ